MVKEDLAAKIVDKVGGPENVNFLTHCATRLRFTLKDPKKVEQDILNATEGILSVVNRSGQTQIVIGNDVASVYEDVMRVPGMKSLGDKKLNDTDPDSGSSKNKKGKFAFVDAFFDFLSDTFRPLLWALIGASMVKTVLILLDKFHVSGFETNKKNLLSTTYHIFNAAGDATFYFLPLMVAATAAMKLKANPWVSVAISATFMHPEFLSLGDPKNNDISFFIGREFDLFPYAGQIFPPILVAVLLAIIEKYLKKWLSPTFHMIFIPLFSLLTLVPLTVMIIGPFGSKVGNGLSTFFTNLYDYSPWLMSMVVAGAYLFMVPLGVHWPLNALQINNINEMGYDFIQPAMGCYNFAVFGLVAGVLIKARIEKNKQMKTLASAGVISGLFAGVSEPSLFGVILRYKRTIPLVFVSAITGGLIVGLFKIKAKAFTFTSLVTIPNMDNMFGYSISIGVSFFMAMLLVLIFDYRTRDQKIQELEQLEKDTNIDSANKENTVEKFDTEITLNSPLEGRVMNYSDIPDKVFASGALGSGIGIDPTGDTVFSPGNGKVLTIQKTGHAVGLRLDSGVDLLIHVGIDTVEMNGDGFQTFVSKGDVIKTGDKLITFDKDKIASAGFSNITAVLVTNSKKFESINSFSSDSASLNTEIIVLRPKVRVES